MNFKKKGDSTHMDNKNNIYDHDINRIFSDFDRQYETFRTQCASKINECTEQLLHEQSRNKVLSEKLNSTIQTREFMEMLLPILSDIRNEVMEADDIEIMKKKMTQHFKTLRKNFSKKGIELQMHERGEEVDPAAVLGDLGDDIETTDPALHNKVACCRQIGCIIKGEENDPIPECIDMYVYTAPAISEQEEIPSQKEPLKEDILPEKTAQSEKTAEETPDQTEQIAQSNKTEQSQKTVDEHPISLILEQEEPPLPAKEPDIIFLPNEQFQFNFSLTARKQNGETYTLISPKTKIFSIRKFWFTQFNGEMCAIWNPPSFKQNGQAVSHNKIETANLSILMNDHTVLYNDLILGDRTLYIRIQEKSGKLYLEISLNKTTPIVSHELTFNQGDKTL